jgi:maltose alpha-D-glucosyltransferase/alpha-amylase
VLIKQNDFVFTDFKGNLKRPFAERHRKCSPLRDVADMLLSCNYAAYTALGHVCAEQPKDMAKFEHLVLEWEREVGRVFLDAYTQTVSDTDLILTDASVHALLELFQLEKALYDVRNELGNRSDLVIISLKYILSLL